MQGIWLLSTQLSGSSFKDGAPIARIVFNVIFIPGIAYVVYAWLYKQQKHREGNPFDAIGYGASALLLWYVLNTVDLFLHESQIKVTYTYIIYYFFLACLKFPADILIVGGSHRIISGQLYIHHRARTPKPVIWLLAGEFLVLVLFILALYYIGSLFAYEILWLQVADASVLLSVRTKRNKIEVAFFVLQYIITLLTLTAASFSFWFSRKQNIPKPYSTIKQKLKPFTAVIAAAILFIRSISELIFVARYYFEGHVYGPGTLASRDLIYGLTTLGFLLMIPYIAREIASAEAEDTKDPLLADIEEDMRRTIIRKVEEYKNTNGGSAPNMSDVIRDVRNNFGNSLQEGTRRKLRGMTPAEGGEFERQWGVYAGRLEGKFGRLEDRDRSREF